MQSSRPGDAESRRCSPRRRSNAIRFVLHLSGSFHRTHKWFKLLSEFLHRAEDAVLGRAGPQVQSLADLFNGPAFHVQHGEGHALGRRERSHGAGDLALHLRAQQQAIGSRPGCRQLHVITFRAVKAFHDLICVFCLHLRFSRIQEVKRAIDRNPVEPCAEVRAKFKPLQALVSAKKRFLHNLLRVLLISGHAIHHAKDAAGMALHQDTKGVPVAGQYQRHYSCIGNFHSINLDRNWGKRLGVSLLKSRSEAREPYSDEDLIQGYRRMWYCQAVIFSKLPPSRIFGSQGTTVHAPAFNCFLSTTRSLLWWRWST